MSLFCLNETECAPFKIVVVSAYLCTIIITLACCLYGYIVNQVVHLRHLQTLAHALTVRRARYTL